MIERLGPYRIVRAIGAGGMGEVYEAVHMGLGRTVALKLLKADRVAGDEVGRRFRREMQIAAALSHPNLVRLFDGGTLDGTPYMAMELVGGEPLSRWLQREPRPPVGWCLNLARQVADGLACLHEREICHRDVKPENILLETDGTAKLADFGLVRTVEGTAITADGGLLGTLPFMAPELLMGDPGSPASDLWALGCVLYTMLAGQGPIVADTPGEWFHAINGAPIRPLAELAPEAGDEVSALVARLLERDRTQRLSSATELSKALVALRSPARRPGGHAGLRSASGLRRRSSPELPRVDGAVARTSPGDRARRPSGTDADVTATEGGHRGRVALVALGVVAMLGAAAFAALLALRPAPPPPGPVTAPPPAPGPAKPGDPRWAPDLVRRIESLKRRDPREAEATLIDGLTELGRMRPEPPWPRELGTPVELLTAALYTRLQDLKGEVRVALGNLTLVLSAEHATRERAFRARFRRHASDLRTVFPAISLPGAPSAAFLSAAFSADLMTAQESRMLDEAAAGWVEAELVAAARRWIGTWRSALLRSCERRTTSPGARLALRREAVALLEAELAARKDALTEEDGLLWHDLVVHAMGAAGLAKDATAGRQIYEYARMRRPQIPKHPFNDDRWESLEPILRTLGEPR